METEVQAGVQFDTSGDRAWPDWVMQRVLPEAADIDAKTMMQRGQIWGLAVTEIMRRRDDAINYRQQEQIEWVWSAAELTYGQTDDQQQGWRTKTDLADSGAMSQQDDVQTRSDAFVRMAARYADAGYAKAAEYVIPPDEKLFRFRPTPIPQEADGTPIPADVAEAAMLEAETWVYDWLTEGRFVGTLRKVIFDCARLGCGVIKGPLPKRKRRRRGRRGSDHQWSIEAAMDMRPESAWVDPWNLFPDPACGEDVQNGDFIFERGFMSRRQVMALLDDPRYDAQAVETVLQEEPKGRTTGASSASDPRTPAQKQTQYEVWWYYGMMPAETLGLRFPKQYAELSERYPDGWAGRDVPVLVTMVHDHVLSATLGTFDSGDFPFDVVYWTRRPGYWAGIGIIEQVMLPQKLINAATRAWIDNAAISSGPQVVLDDSAIYPADGVYRIEANKIWLKTADTGIDDVAKAFTTYDIPSHASDLKAMIEYAKSLFEESTNMPLVTQGQSGKSQPKTFGGMSLLNTNANQLLRQVVENFEEQLLMPHLSRYYEWLIVDPRVPDSAKGDFRVQANGAVALIDRDQQDQLLLQLMDAAHAPQIFGLDGKRLVRKFLKSRRINPEDVMHTPEELKRLAENQPPPPQIAVAQMRREADQEKLLGKLRETQGQQEIERDRVGVQAAQMMQTAQAQADATEVKLRHMELEFNIRLLQYATQEKITVQQANASLTETVMELKVQKELAVMEPPPTGQVRKPRTEPKGKAPKGRAYQA